MFDFTDRVRQKFTNKLLDIVETLPEFQGGPIADLQRTRKDQRDYAENAQKHTQRPEGMEVTITGFQMFELYQVETYSSIESRLLKLFPNLQELFNKDTLRSMRDVVNNYTEGGWANIGIVARNKGFFGISIVRQDSELPETIHHISITMHKILPSVIAILFDVHLTDEASRYLSYLQSKSYLAKVEFKHFFPYFGNYGHKITNAEAIKVATILEWLNKLHLAAQKSVKPLLFGYFSTSINTREKLLPSVELYLIKGVTESILSDPVSYENWLDSSRGWLQSLGFNLNSYHPVFKAALGMLTVQMYRNGHGDGYFRSSSFSRLIVLEEPFAKEENLDRFGGDIKTALNLYYRDGIMDDIITYLVVLEFLKVAKQRIEDFKRLVFHRMGRSRWLHRHIILSEVILREQALARVIFAEFEQIQQRLEKHKGYHLDLKMDIDFGPSKGEKSSLANELTTYINFTIKLLTQHINQTNEVYSNYLSLRNMEAIFWLQFVAAIAALLSVIAVVIQIVGVEGIKNLIQYWK